jgi:hypothetical protein
MLDSTNTEMLDQPAAPIILHLSRLSTALQAQVLAPLILLHSRQHALSIAQEG